MSARKKRKTGLIIAAAAVVAVVAVVALIPKDTAPAMASASTEALGRMDLKSTVSVTGAVVSDSEGDVYAKLAGIPMETVNVEVGDTVKAGDVLALFDTESIEDQIATQKATMSQTSAINQQQIKLAEKQRKQQIADFQENQDADLLSAKLNVNNALNALTQAKNNLEDFGSDVTTMDEDVFDQQPTITKDKFNYTIALQSYRASQEQVEEAKKELAAAQSGGNAQEIADAKDRLEVLEKEMERCKNVFEVEQISHPTIQHQYEQAELAVKQAQDAYDLALQQYDVTWNKTLQGIDTAQDNIDTSVISSNQTVSRLSLEQLEKKLDDAIVTAPISGTVTAVYAEEGATPSGLLFIIEDTDKLKIETTVKEYDLPSVKIGQKVEIKSDGIGDRVITGKVEKIAPTAVKAAAGSANSSGSVEFAVEISVDEPHEGLLIGMKARVSIVLQEALGVYGIPYDAVLTDPDGSTYVLAAEAGEKGYTAKRIPVQVGMESDFYVEISGDGLTDGLLVITNPAGITEGMPVPVSQPEGV